MLPSVMVQADCSLRRFSESSAATADMFRAEASHGSSDSDFNSDSGTVNLKFT